MKSKIISVSAITSAIIAIFLTFGAYIEMFDLWAVVIASVFVLIPLYYNSYLGAILSSIAGGIIAFMFSGFNLFSVVFPAFFGFFGFYPIFRVFVSLKRKNNVVRIIIGLIWCAIAIYGIYLYYTFVMEISDLDLPKFLMDNIYLFLMPVSVLFYFLFDKFVLVAKFTIDKYAKRVLK